MCQNLLPLLMRKNPRVDVFIGHPLGWKFFQQCMQGNLKALQFTPVGRQRVNLDISARPVHSRECEIHNNIVNMGIGSGILRGKIYRGGTLCLPPKTLHLAAFVHHSSYLTLSTGKSKYDDSLSPQDYWEHYISLEVALTKAQLHSRSTLQYLIRLLDLPPPLFSSSSSYIAGGSIPTPQMPSTSRASRSTTFLPPPPLGATQQLLSVPIEKLQVQHCWQQQQCVDNLALPPHTNPVPVRMGGAWVMIDVEVFQEKFNITYHLGYALEMANVDG